MPNDSAVIVKGQPTPHQGKFVALVGLLSVPAKLRGSLGIAFSWEKVCVLFYTF